MDSKLPIVRALILLQQYPGPLLLPVAVMVVIGMGVNHALAQLTISRFGHFLIFVAGLLIHFFLVCVAFICVANYTARCEANGEKPELRQLFDSFAYPGYGQLIGALFARFVLTIVLVAIFTVLLLAPAFAAFRGITHHSPPRLVSGAAYIWVATIFAIAILTRWVFAIPLFSQSKGLLRSAWEISVKVVRGRQVFIVFFTLSLRAITFPFIQLTSPLHPHLSDGAARYVPQMFEIFAAYGLHAVVWAYWMIVMTLLAMQLQSVDASDSSFSTAPAASA
jgi:hypothetical protein